MSASHKAALAKGRRESRVVAAYLEALNASRGKRGRKRTPKSIDDRLNAIARILPTASQLHQLELIQERMNLEAERAHLGIHVDLSALEKDFVQAAKQFAERRGLSYAAFRAKGVPAGTLAKAGVKRTRG